MAKCIYCLNEKPKKDFNVEHVISKALGTFNQTLVLHGVVCAKCNSIISSAETAFIEDSVEGFFTAAYGLNPAKQSFPFRGKRFKFTPKGDNNLGIFNYAFPRIDLKTGAKYCTTYILRRQERTKAHTSPVHFVAFREQDGAIFGEVCLFAYFKYVIRMGKCSTSLSSSLSFGNAHYFF